MNPEIAMLTSVITFVSVLMAALLGGYFNSKINERKLEYESAQKNKEFYRDKYEQLTLKFIQLHNILNEEKYLRMTEQELKSELSKVAELGAEVEMLIKLYFPSLKSSFEQYNRAATYLYTTIKHDSVENMLTAYNVYSTKANYLIDLLGDDTNVYEYTKKLHFTN